MQKKKRMDLLLVEDNEADAYLTRMALREALSDCRITTVTDGEKALACIRDHCRFGRSHFCFWKTGFSKHKNRKQI